MEGATILIMAISKAAACRRRKSEEKQDEEEVGGQQRQTDCQGDAGYSAAGDSGPKLDLGIPRPPATRASKNQAQNPWLHYPVGSSCQGLGPLHRRPDSTAVPMYHAHPPEGMAEVAMGTSSSVG